MAQAERYQATLGGIAIAMALALLVAFCVLAAQFEGFIHPVIIGGFLAASILTLVLYELKQWERAGTNKLAKGH